MFWTEICLFMALSLFIMSLFHLRFSLIFIYMQISRFTYLTLRKNDICLIYFKKYLFGNENSPTEQFGINLKGTRSAGKIVPQPLP